MSAIYRSTIHYASLNFAADGEEFERKLSKIVKAKITQHKNILPMPIKVLNMKLGYTLFLLLSFIIHSYGQSTSVDSASTEKHIYSDKVTGGQGSMFSYKTEKQKKLVIKDNLTFTTYGFQMSPIENEILDLEVLECRALLNRDTSILKSVWSRDFTLDDSSTKILINGKNPLPYYASLKRVVENFTARDNFVYTSGYEFFQQLKTDGAVEAPVKRNYFHTWTRKNGVWKLLTKTHS